MKSMRMWVLIAVLLAVGTAGWSQQSSAPASPLPASPSTQSGDGAKQEPQSQPHAPNLSPPRSDRVSVDQLGDELGQSSSKDTQVDLSAPDDDQKKHPKSSATVAEAEAGLEPGGVIEAKVWNPQKAAKSIEVGDFYFKRKNYRAAEGRYREALVYKGNDALATIKLAICLEKLGVLDDARAEYESYLTILPHGPEAEQAQKAVERLKSGSGAH